MKTKELEWFDKVNDKLHVLTSTLRPNYIEKLKQDVSPEKANDQRSYMASWLEMLCTELEEINDTEAMTSVENILLRHKNAT
jgi:hypothetical protein